MSSPLSNTLYIDPVIERVLLFTFEEVPRSREKSNLLYIGSDGPQIVTSVESREKFMRNISEFNVNFPTRFVIDFCMYLRRF